MFQLPAIPILSSFFVCLVPVHYYFYYYYYYYHHIAAIFNTFEDVSGINLKVKLSVEL